MVYTQISCLPSPCSWRANPAHTPQWPPPHTLCAPWFCLSGHSFLDGEWAPGVGTMKELKLWVLADLGSVSRCAPRKPWASESLGSCKNKETYTEEGGLSQAVARPWARALVPSSWWWSWCPRAGLSWSLLCLTCFPCKFTATCDSRCDFGFHVQSRKPPADIHISASTPFLIALPLLSLKFMALVVGKTNGTLQTSELFVSSVFICKLQSFFLFHQIPSK